MPLQVNNGPFAAVSICILPGTFVLVSCHLFIAVRTGPGKYHSLIFTSTILVINQLNAQNRVL